jgi:LuxR family maltose regulon positive regulatory protein
VARTPALLAKLSRPRLYRILDRDRLYDRLEAARGCSATWISGPPGAGKTSLAASYLTARKLSAIWYDVDSGDSDPASLFHHLSLAAPKGRNRRAQPLQSLSPEYQDLEGFTRRFLRAFYARLSGDCVIVFDNCHAVRADAPLPCILRQALEELPQGLRLIMISRTDPPATLARAEANGLLARIGWDELRLTREELRAIVLASHQTGESTLTQLQQRSSGWPVGLVLLLQRLKASGSIDLTPDGAPVGSVNYFADQVFERLAPSMRELLLRTSFMPRVTAADASVLAANPAAGELLEELFRQRLFTDRHSGTQISYQYHALFREFLQTRVISSLTTDEARALRATSARLLEESGEFAAALAIRADNQDWDDANRVILKQARTLVADGRWRTLQSMIARLPSDQVEKSPWLSLWLGAAIVLVDPTRARQILARAFEMFRAVGDHRGCLIAATGIVETHNIEQVGIDDLDRWIPVLERGIGPGVAYPNPAERVRVLTAFLVAATLRQPAHPAMPSCLREVEDALELDIPLTAKADTATQLLAYYCYTHQLFKARGLVARVGSIFDLAKLTSFRRAGWLVYSGFYSALTGGHDAGIQALDALRTIVGDFGMKWFRLYDPFFRALLFLMGPAPLQAAALVHELGERVDPNRHAETALYHLARTLLYQARGEPSLATYHGELCLDAAEKSRAPYFSMLYSTVISSAFVEAGQLSRALQLLEQARTLCTGTVFIHHEPLILMAEAYRYQAAGQGASAAAALAKSLRRAQADQSASALRWLVVGFRRMLPLALASNTEGDIARGFIRELAILPESPDVENWPWQIQLRLLGGFELQTLAAPQRSTGKAPRKPLEILKVLAVQPAGEMSAAGLAALLWPDAEGDAALESLEVTLRRLRKLLGSDHAVRLHEGTVALNESICRVDTLAFERAHQRAEQRLMAPDLLEPELLSLSQRLLSLYPGHVLPGDEEQPWLLAARQRLGSRMFRDLIAIGRRWEERAQWEQAEIIYRRGVELEAVSEVLYRRLMSVQICRADRAGALATYARCRQMMSFTLGVAPSAETEALRRSAMTTS